MSNESPISILGIGPNDPPGVYLQTSFAQGTPSLGNTKRSVILLGNMNESTGTAQVDGYIYGPDTLTTLGSTNDASGLFGSGSPLARLYSAFVKVNPNTPVYASPVKAATGVGASLAITVGGPATLSGTVRCNIGSDSPVDVSFSTGDTATVIASAVAAAVNSNPDLPVTASSSTGVLTLTRKVPGLRGNFQRASLRVLNGAGVTSSVVRPTFFSGGTGSDSYTNVLNTLALNGNLFYYYVVEAGCDNVDATQFEACQAQIDFLAQPANGLRQRLVGGSVDSLAHTEAVTAAVNDPRCECLWLQNSDMVAGEMAANGAAAFTLFEAPPLTAAGVNFDGFGNDPQSAPFWNALRAPLDGSAPSQSAIKSASLSGITPIKVQAGGRTSIVKRVTTKYLNGSVNDYRITDAGKVTICDYFADDLVELLLARYPRKMVANDPVSGQPPAGPNVVTPSKVQNTVIELINKYSAAGLIDGPSVIKTLVVQRETSPSSRIGISVPLFTNDLLHTFGVQINQVN